jgi:hypothetical protein
MAKGLEKRQFQRLHVPIEVTAEIATAGEQSEAPVRLHIQSRNISKTGICLETMSLEIDGINLLSGPPWARANRLKLNIALIPEEPPFTAIGEVRWYDVVRHANESMYQVGIEFLEVKDNGKDQLARFLKSRRTGVGFFRRFFR